MSRELLREPAISSDMDGKSQARGWDREIGSLAWRQYGVVSRGQLLDLGLREGAIDRRLRAGRLYRMHSGVYAVGHQLISRDGRRLAAVLASGRAAVLSHRSAAELWGVKRGSDGPIDVTTTRALGSLSAIRRHQAVLLADEVTTRRRIPVTTLARTLFDVAAEMSAEGFEGAMRQAEYLHRFRVRSLEELLDRHPGRRGAKTIRATLVSEGPRGRARSSFEARFIAMLARTKLPRPELNVLLDLGDRMIEADCLWRAQKLIVELDGGKAHRTRAAFESDRDRDRRAQVAGWRVIRVTWRQLSNPQSLLEDLRRLLAVEPAISSDMDRKRQAR